VIKLEHSKNALAESMESFIWFLNRWVESLYRQLQSASDEPSITQRQYWVLCILKKGGPYKMSELGEILQTTYGSLTVMIDRLVEKGLVERFYLPDDRRVVMVRITHDGRMCLEQYKNKFLDIIVKNLERLTEEDRKRLSNAIDEVITIVKNISDL